jgi:hypothetical protein
METLANLADHPEGIPGWDDDAEIPSTWLLSICTDGGILHYCLSPDLEPRQIAFVYEGDVDPLDFSAEFDELLMSRIKYYRS